MAQTDLAENETKPPDDTPVDKFGVTIQAVRQPTKDVISALLNPPKIFLSDTGLPRDWHGLAQLVGIGGERIPALQCGADETNKIINMWYQYDKDGATITKLLQYLEQIDRYDIVDDIMPMLEEDVKIYEQRSLRMEAPIKKEIENDNFILTRDDMERVGEGLELQQYDAFVLFAEEDISFATELIDVLENQHKLKLCVRERDLMVGVFEHDSIVRLIAERCNRLVPILSPAFLDSSSNKFFCNFAQSLGIDQRKRKIVPCLFRQCKLPPELSCYFMLDYTRPAMGNFWERLRDSIRTPTTNASKKLPIYRSASQKIPTSNECNGVSVLQSNTLKPKKEGVKFSSMVNLNLQDDEVQVNQMIPPSASSSNLMCMAMNGETKKKKKVLDKLKKLLPQKNGKCASVIDEIPVQHKKSFWQRTNKRKLKTVFPHSQQLAIENCG